MYAEQVYIKLEGHNLAKDVMGNYKKEMYRDKHKWDTRKGYTQGLSKSISEGQHFRPRSVLCNADL